VGAGGEGQSQRVRPTVDPEDSLVEGSLEKQNKSGKSIQWSVRKGVAGRVGNMGKETRFRRDGRGRKSQQFPYCGKRQEPPSKRLTGEKIIV